MKKDKALDWCRKYVKRLRETIQDQESGMDGAYTMGALFGDPGGGESNRIIGARKVWARALAELHELEEDLGTGHADEWWNGPKQFDKEPVIGDRNGEGLGYMMACMRDGEHRTRERQIENHKRWEKEQRNEHWSRLKEALAQRKNPKRKLRILRRAENGAAS